MRFSGWDSGTEKAQQIQSTEIGIKCGSQLTTVRQYWFTDCNKGSILRKTDQVKLCKIHGAILCYLHNFVVNLNCSKITSLF